MGQFHHGKAMNWIRSMVFLDWYFFCWLASFLVSDKPECRIQYYIFSAMEVRSVFINSLHTWEAHHILPSSFKLYYCYSKVNIVGFHKNFDLDRPSNCKINCWVSRWRAHEHHCSICTLTEVAHGMVCFRVTLGDRYKFLWCRLCMAL